MIDINITEELLTLLRSLLLLIPLFLTFQLAKKHINESRFLIGGLFSFLYSIGLLLPAHALAIKLGMWRYGSEELVLMGMPADLWFAGSFLFGPTIFFSAPKVNPLLLAVGFILLQALVFTSLNPLVIAGENWFWGIVLIFITVHIPALYLAKWTANNSNLPQRAILLAIGYGFLAFCILPTLIMQAMGGGWNLAEKSTFDTWLTLCFLLPCFVMGLGAVNMFVVHGKGTPIPLDKTEYLVRSGLYAYIANPMQMSTALSWIVIGIYLQNIFVALAAGMAVVFVLGLVRWHHRIDLCVRFPNGWPEYQKNVPVWFPRWKPWILCSSTFRWNPKSKAQRIYVNLLKKVKIHGLNIIESNHTQVHYVDSNSGRSFTGVTALAYTLFHTNFLLTLIASALLILIMPFQYFASPEIKKKDFKNAKP